MVRKYWITHFGMTDLSKREKTRSRIALGLGILAIGVVGGLLFTKVLVRERELHEPLILGVLMVPLFWLFFTGFSYVRVGLDRVVVRHALGGFTLRQQDIVSFRYVGKLRAPQEWYVESARGLHPLGAGHATTTLVEQMLGQWPRIPRPSDAAISALGAADYRHESKDPAELVEILRIPSLAPDERVRIAELLSKHGPEYEREVASIAEATLDPGERARLRSIS